MFTTIQLINYYLYKALIMKNSKLLNFVFLTLITGSITATAIAADNKAVIVHRQGIYDVMAGHMKVLKSILFLKHPKVADVNFHAKSILEAAKHHGNAFPEGSGKGKTAALPAIWEKPEEFKKAGQKLGKALAEFIEVSELADADDLSDVQASFKKVGGACKNCHDDFRKEKK